MRLIAQKENIKEVDEEVDEELDEEEDEKQKLPMMKVKENKKSKVNKILK